MHELPYGYVWGSWHLRLTVKRMIYPGLGSTPCCDPNQLWKCGQVISLLDPPEKWGAGLDVLQVPSFSTFLRNHLLELLEKTGYRAPCPWVRCNRVILAYWKDTYGECLCNKFICFLLSLLRFLCAHLSLLLHIQPWEVMESVSGRRDPGESGGGRSWGGTSLRWIFSEFWKASQVMTTETSNMCPAVVQVTGWSQWDQHLPGTASTCSWVVWPRMGRSYSGRPSSNKKYLFCVTLFKNHTTCGPPVTRQ